MVGETAIDLVDVALLCLTGPDGVHTGRYPLRSTADVSAPLVGYVELVLQVVLQFFLKKIRLDLFDLC